MPYATRQKFREKVVRNVNSLGWIYFNVAIAGIYGRI